MKPNNTPPLSYLRTLHGATFSVSNLGMYGIITFTPNVNPPGAAILGVGTIRRELRLDPHGNPEEHRLCDLSLTD
jgi:pyruvate dehydrogenase E2 component (dihydrolipoamide acetyltransferase)